MPLHSRIAYLLQYEPTWFPEFCSGLGILLWSLGCFLTPDIPIAGGAWIMPMIGVLFGPARWLLLVRVIYAPRMAAATLGEWWWTWLANGMWSIYGIVPTLGVIVGLGLVGDLLTMGRFSIPCLRDLIADLRRPRG